MNDCMPEEWRPVLGYEGFYEVSDDGRVRSLDRTTVTKIGTSMSFKGRQMTATVRKQSGYHVVALNAHGRERQRKIHQLVCEAFHGSRPSSEYQVRHLNGNKDDNRASNLAWGTASENTQDSIRHGTQWQLRKTHCPEGHPYDEANTGYTRLETRTGRFCRTCDRAAKKVRYQRDHPTTCEKGHPYDRVAKNGRRYCWQCSSEANSEAKTRVPFVQRTHCRRGHQMIPENTSIGGRGNWECKECKRVSRRLREQRDAA